MKKKFVVLIFAATGVIACNSGSNLRLESGTATVAATQEKSNHPAPSSGVLSFFQSHARANDTRTVFFSNYDPLTGSQKSLNVNDLEQVRSIQIFNSLDAQFYKLPTGELYESFQCDNSCWDGRYEYTAEEITALAMIVEPTSALQKVMLICGDSGEKIINGTNPDLQYYALGTPLNGNPQMIYSFTFKSADDNNCFQATYAVKNQQVVCHAAKSSCEVPSPNSIIY